MIEKHGIDRMKKRCGNKKKMRKLCGYRLAFNSNMYCLYDDKYVL